MLAGVIVGIVLGLTVPALRLITFTPTIEAGAVLNALAILIVGLLIDYAYRSHASSKQSDTELLLDLVKDANTAFRGLERASQLCKSGKKLLQKERAELLAAERALSNEVGSLEKALGHCNITLDRLDFEKLKDARKKLKDRLTDTPYPGPYDERSLQNIEDALRRMRDDLVRVAFAINHR